MVREISTQIKTTWIQLIFGNALLQPTSVRKCPGPEYVVFCIEIVDITFIRSLAGFSLLRSMDYYYRKGPVCYILMFYSQYSYCELSILFLFILSQDTPAYVHLLLL